MCANLPSPVRLRRKYASRYLMDTHGVSYTPQSLATLASIGGGPAYILFGRFPMYAPADLDAWVAAKVRTPVQK